MVIHGLYELSVTFLIRLGGSNKTLQLFVPLCSLAEYCNFGGTLDLMLRDRLVCGINNELMLRLLLAEMALTCTKVLEIATSQEMASQDVQTIRGTHSYTTPLSGARTPSDIEVYR